MSIEYGRPRRVAGGLTARSTRGAIGRSWWSRRFLDVLESFALGTRLTRGRAYARAGQVLQLRVTPGVVTATVQGSQVEPYRVSVRLDAFSGPVWARIEALLAGQAFFSARLLAGDLPPELEEVLAGAGAPLFPGDVRDLAMSCDCPDFAVPCKHLAATFYLLAEAFDADPFELLHWRGRTRDDLLSRLRQLRTAALAATNPTDTPGGGRPAGVDAGGGRPAGVDTGGGRPAGVDTGGAGTPRDAGADTHPQVGDPAVAAARSLASAALADLPEVTPATALERFWVAPVQLPARPPTLDTASDLLLRQLRAPDASIGGPGLVERLSRAYRRFGETSADSSPS